MLETLLAELKLSNTEPEARGISLNTDDEGQIHCIGGNFGPLVESLNQLKLIDQGTNHGGNDDLDSNVALLLKNVSEAIKDFDSSYIVDEKTREFLRVVSIASASDKINELIKLDMNTGLIDKIVAIYLNIIDVMKSMRHSSGQLLSRTSFISPLLITISFSFKLKHPKSNSLVKILTMIFVFHLNHRPLIESIVKMFSVNSSTNMDVFEVFNKLWETTLQLPTDTSQVVKHSPGPITLMNRVHILRDCTMSIHLIDQILPYQPNQMLLRLSKDIVSIYSALLGLKNNLDTSVFLNIMSLLNSEMSCETFLSLTETLGMSQDLLKLREDPEFNTTLDYILFKISSTLNLKNPKLGIQYISKITQADVFDAIDESIYARYKVVFETIDHNYKINFHCDYQMSFLLENALCTIEKQFKLIDDQHVITEFGSIFSIESLFIYNLFIAQRSILENVNPDREIPLNFMALMNLKRFPPLPRSNFTDFSIKNITGAQINTKNLQRLINSTHLCLLILKKIIREYIKAKGPLDNNDRLDGKYISMEYRATEELLKHYFTSLFTVLIVSNELCTKAQTLSNSFFDYESTGKVLRLQVFQIFEDLFLRYGSFAFYVLLQFVTQVSECDLQLQELSMMLLNHLTFHSSTSLKNEAVKNDIIKSLIKNFVTTWDDGSIDYSYFNKLLGLPNKLPMMAEFDKTKYMKVFKLIDTNSTNSSPRSGTSMGFQNTAEMPPQDFMMNSVTPAPLNVNPRTKLNLITNQNDNMKYHQQSFKPQMMTATSQNLAYHQQDYSFKTSNVQNVTPFTPQQQTQVQKIQMEYDYSHY
jgi:hypothetical protein